MCATSCAEAPEPEPAPPFVFTAHAPLEGVTSARVDGVDYPLVFAGSGSALNFVAEYADYATAIESPFIVVEFFQGAALHHVGYLHLASAAEFAHHMSARKGVRRFWRKRSVTP